jgi:hypothetical protein
LLAGRVEGLQITAEDIVYKVSEGAIKMGGL